MRVLLVVAAALMLLTGCEDRGPETVNQADGEHEMFKGKTAKWPMDRKIQIADKWSKCTWFTEVQDAQGAPRRTVKNGTEKDYAYIVWVDGRRAWITFNGCGQPTVAR